MGNLGCGCPGSMARVIEREETTAEVPARSSRNCASGRCSSTWCRRPPPTSRTQTSSLPPTASPLPWGICTAGSSKERPLPSPARSWMKLAVMWKKWRRFH